ncbi:MAG TPA: VIT and VWA domain-containing protein [Humisphaera sp.]|jgi:Ca-activated chloride channel family protein|nr:VIT and VWA domain-containing protein [Humisphaera sp.]
MSGHCVRVCGRQYFGWGRTARACGHAAKKSRIVAGVVGVVLAALLLLPAIARADGFIIVQQSTVVVRGHFSFAPLEVSYHHVDVSIKDQVATTSVDQEFYNPNNARLEGTYIFPLPRGAHIDKFQMEIDGVMQQAELLDSGEARSIYEDIVRKMRDPALLEYAGRDAFQVHIFPIEPNSRKRIKVAYTQLLKSDSGLVEYSYPLNTEKFSSRPLRDVSINLTIDSKDPIKSVYSPSHPVNIHREGEHQANVTWHDHNVRPDTDFKVLFSRTQKPLGVDLLTYKSGAEGYFLLLASPGMVAPRGAVQSKDVCFVIDTSGSMSEDGGKKIEQARKSLSFCLQNLNKGDRFDVIRFSTEVEPLYEGLVDADREHLNRAQEFVSGLQPIGGTAIDEALRTALKMRPRESGRDRGTDRPYIVIFITDGLPTVGQSNEDAILANVGRADQGATRIFCFGLGTDVNTHLLDRLAEQTNAVSQYVLPNEDLEVKLGEFYTKIKEPVLANVHVNFDGRDIRVSQLYPNQIPDLFRGQMLVLFGRYGGGGPGLVKISGSLNGERQEFTTDVNFGGDDSANSFIPRLWATRRVGYLLDEIRLHGESPELKDEVTSLARRFGIVTPYTAYLIMEDEKRRDVPRGLQSFSELSADRQANETVRERYAYARDEAKDASKRTGQEAIDNAQALAQLKSGENQQQAQQQAGQQAMAKGQQGGAPPEGARSFGGGGGYGGGGGGGGFALGGRRGAGASAQPGSAGSAAGPATTQPAYGYRDAQNYAQQARVIRDRTFYQNGDIWTDSTAQENLAKNKDLKQREVKFGSDEFFAILAKHPEASEWLALGEKVDVMLDGELVKIR